MTEKIVTVEKMIEYIGHFLDIEPKLALGTILPMPPNGVPVEWRAQIIRHYWVTRRITFDDRVGKIILDRPEAQAADLTIKVIKRGIHDAVEKARNVKDEHDF